MNAKRLNTEQLDQNYEKNEIVNSIPLDSEIIKTGEIITIEKLAEEINSVDWKQISGEELSRISNFRIEHPLTNSLKELDPFSDEYRSVVLCLYKDIRSSARFLKSNYFSDVDSKNLEIAQDYDVERDEQNKFISKDIFKNAPYNVTGSSFLAEHFYSWAHLFDNLNISDAETVLEYGPGSGQILLTLARMGISTFGVDINQSWLDVINSQASLMNLKVSLERNYFGEGFEGQRFDRIIFYEAFHHALNFNEIIKKLKNRLNHGGFILFCGEPIADQFVDWLPYPWGPRLDGDSVRAILTEGWMELGFTNGFFSEMLKLNGFHVERLPFQKCGRALIYKAS